ncbi:neuroendocrine convertase 2-like isoform X2 [Mya arenaria]|nr:neuroendocrine convertase 2-like isoform X2 [Mya arenaria]
MKLQLLAAVMMVFMNRIAKSCIDYNLDTTYTNRIIVKCNERELDGVITGLDKIDIKYRNKVISGFYTFELPDRMNGELNATWLSLIHKQANYKIQLEQCENLFPKAGLEPFDRPKRDVQSYSAVRSKRSPNPAPDNGKLFCRPFYDELLSIEKAWEFGYTGKGLSIAILDVGVDIDHPELKDNIDVGISYNFIDKDDSANVIPEFHGYLPASFYLTNHGNAVASIVAGVTRNKTCDYCGAGVAFDSELVVLKTAGVDLTSLQYPIGESDVFTRALAYRPNCIDIYLSGWDFNRTFTKITDAQESVLRRGVTEGRHGKGSIFVFPVGLPGNAFTNTIFTIGVNNIGVDGTVAEDSFVNSATLVSAFGDGRSRHHSGLPTAYRTRMNIELHELCTMFHGRSSAAAIVTGIIALTLQANKRLSLRDIKHILVESTSSSQLAESPNFHRNGAGYYCHDTLGFGYPNALKMVKKAKEWTPLPPVYNVSDHQEHDVTKGDKCLMHFNVVKKRPSVTQIEEMIVDVWTKMPRNERFNLKITSPCGTESVLMDNLVRNTPTAHFINAHVTFLTYAFWGENSFGEWTLEMDVKGEKSYSPCHLGSADITFFGTIEERVKPNCISNEQINITSNIFLVLGSVICVHTFSM